MVMLKNLMLFGTDGTKFFHKFIFFLFLLYLLPLPFSLEKLNISVYYMHVSIIAQLNC